MTVTIKVKIMVIVMIISIRSNYNVKECFLGKRIGKMNLVDCSKYFVLNKKVLFVRDWFSQRLI